MLLVFSLAAGLALAKTWTMSDGSQIQGEVVSISNGMVIFRKTSGGRMLLSPQRFSEADQAYLREQYPGELPEEEADAPTPSTAAAPQASRQPYVMPSAPESRPAPTASTETSEGFTPEPSSHPGLARLERGHTPPPLNFRDRERNEVVQLGDYRGKLLAVFFWSPNSRPSINQLYEVAQIDKGFELHPFQVMSVCVQGNRAIGYPILEQAGAGKSWPNAFDLNMTIAGSWGVTALPTMVIINENGIIEHEHLSVRDLFGLLVERFGEPQRPSR